MTAFTSGIPFYCDLSLLNLGRFPIAFLIFKLILAKKKIAHLQEIILNVSLTQYYSRYWYLILIQSF